jgi:serine/threonine-protein kinase ATR
VALLNVVDPDSIQTLIHHTFSTIKQNWINFDTATQIRAREVVADLIETYNTSILEHVDMLPSLNGIELLQKFESDIRSHKQRLDSSVMLEAFAKRCKDENSTVVRQALEELEPFLDKCQRLLHESASGQQPMPIIGQLCRSLLDASIRFKELHVDISDLCAKCLGIIGCIDSNRVETVREMHGILVLSNFDSLPEVLEFIAHMLETVLVDAFRSAPTGKAQSYLAYVIQELLNFSGITEAVNKRSKASPAKPAYVRWCKILESVQSTLTPYLNSKYRLTNAVVATDILGFPEDGEAPPHATWLRTLVFSLLHRGKGHNAESIFPVISRVIPGHDLAIASFMLPFAIQNVVVGGTNDEIDFIKREMNAILVHPIEHLTQTEAENVKQCSEVSLTLAVEDPLLIIEECLPGPGLSFPLAPGKEQAHHCLRE